MAGSPCPSDSEMILGLWCLIETKLYSYLSKSVRETVNEIVAIRSVPAGRIPGLADQILVFEGYDLAVVLLPRFKIRRFDPAHNREVGAPRGFVELYFLVDQDLVAEITAEILTGLQHKPPWIIGF